ncbi:hypothetical protein E2C01_012174 [Portunus trituberculatus]|uniref:Uncharacterized protein n=1 Tax=Portunus trituberculatus TaxID=210409 RepID=A0A5B7DDB2_PORTR|nr:hypothetical protein [Portunus trituberculatus]
MRGILGHTRAVSSFFQVVPTAERGEAMVVHSAVATRPASRGSGDLQPTQEPITNKREVLPDTEIHATRVNEMISGQLDKRA